MLRRSHVAGTLTAVAPSPALAETLDERLLRQRAGQSKTYTDERWELLAKGTSPNIPDRGGRTAVHVAARIGAVETLQALLQAGGDPNAADEDGNMDPSRKSGGALHRLHCFCLEFDGACEVQRRVPTDWIIEPIDVSGYGSFSLAS